MTDQDELRDRIEQIIEDKTSAPAPDGLIAAQAIINEFGMTVRGDDCGYHEIYGSYDTRFGKWEQQ